MNEQIARAMIGHLFTGFLDEKKEEEALPDVTLLNATLKQLLLQPGRGQALRLPL